MEWKPNSSNETPGTIDGVGSVNAGQVIGASTAAAGRLQGAPTVGDEARGLGQTKDDGARTVGYEPAPQSSDSQHESSPNVAAPATAGAPCRRPEHGDAQLNGEISQAPSSATSGGEVEGEHAQTTANVTDESMPAKPPIDTPSPNGFTLKQLFNVRNLASVRLTVLTLSLIAATVLLGAWCPQESAAGQEKIIQQFGEQMGTNLIQWGIADIFHSPWFLGLIAVLTINMVACSMQRVFPKVRLLKQAMPFIGAQEISRLPYHGDVTCACPAGQVVQLFEKKLRRQGYVVRRQGNRISAEFGKFAKLAATVTHIGLLTLLVGVTITSWTGFGGFKPVRLGDSLTFQDSEHSKQWIGKLPTWRVHVDATRREDYDTGEAKQWYSDLSVYDTNDKLLTKQQISVNNPLSYEGVDVYQSSWGLDKLKLEFNGREQSLQLRPMGKRFAAFLPLDPTAILIFSVKNQTSPLRVFAKRPDWGAPRLLAEVPPGGTIRLGDVQVRYAGLIPLTGLQYKCDPGLPITYVAFGFIICGVLLAMIPYRVLWACVNEVGDEGGEPISMLSAGGRSVKSRVGFERSMTKLMLSIKNELGAKTAATPVESAAPAEAELAALAGGKGKNV
ncbi:MAG TPA: cytochrome c biogenesis protein ResB [Planktothrix sp.]|jgi:cytochrome c biogenesis protein